jgi:hypothetical protein
MPPSPDTAARPAHHYRLPALLQDIRLLDLVEISGTTQEASRAAGLSQPTVSRRVRLLAGDFELALNRRPRLGYGSSPAMRLLRLGCRAHRLAAGVARLGADLLLQPLLAECPWLLSAPPRFRPLEGWLELVREGVLDGALVSGLEWAADDPPPHDGLALLPLGGQPFELAIAAGQTVPTGRPPTVLLPPRAAAPGLQRALAQRGLSLRTAGNTCHTPAQWLRRLERSGVAMPLPQLEPASWWQELQRLPLATPLQLPLWLALPSDWHEHGVLAHTAERLRRPQADSYAGIA